MFSTPKWLIFALIMFGGIHVVSWLMETGTLAGLTTPNMSYDFGIAGSFSKIFFYDYAYLDGPWFFFKFILAVVQAVFVFLALKEVADWIRGR